MSIPQLIPPSVIFHPHFCQSIQSRLSTSMRRNSVIDFKVAICQWNKSAWPFASQEIVTCRPLRHGQDTYCICIGRRAWAATIRGVSGQPDDQIYGGNRCQIAPHLRRNSTNTRNRTARERQVLLHGGDHHR